MPVFHGLISSTAQLLRRLQQVCSLAFVAVAAFLGASVAVSAADWSQEQVCAAGVFAYFFLQEMPDTLGEHEGWTVFRSNSGATYDCRLNGNRVLLKWKYGSEAKTSQSTSWTSTQDNLMVHTDIGTYPFRLHNSELRPLD